MSEFVTLGNIMVLKLLFQNSGSANKHDHVRRLNPLVYPRCDQRMTIVGLFLDTLCDPDA